MKINYTGSIEKLNDEIIKEVENSSHTIYWSDSTCKHWIFDFKIKNVWFESTNIDMVKDEITLNVF